LLDSIILGDVARISTENRELLKRFEDSTLLISGGGGFLGAYIIDVLQYCNENIFKKPCKVICLENFITGVPERIKHLLSKEHISIMNKDVSKPFEIDIKPDYIIHCAGIASPTVYRKFPLETIEVNVMGLKNLLELARKSNVKSFLSFSTSEIYGNPTPENIPTQEAYNGNVSCTGPRACYDESKRLGETLCVSYYQQYGIPIKVVRPFNVYGPGLRLDDRRVIPDYFKDAFLQGKIVLLSDGKPTRSFCYISDATIGFIKALLSDCSGEAFNIGNDEIEISMLDLAKKVAEIIGDVEIEHQQSIEKNYLTDNPQRRCPDLTKSKKLLAYYPSVHLQEGLLRLKQWYINNYNLKT
jgi:dTDP-glucose 4,6-dehydratase/UDP-glucuronate decarboxylase